MGLDAVELVMNVEDEFDIVIHDENYQHIRTVGDLCGYIGQKRKVKQLCLNPAAFVRIRHSLLTQFGLARHQIRTTTDMEELFPIENRREQWKVFETSLGLRIPALEYSRRRKQQVIGMLMGLVVAMALLSFLHPSFIFGCLLTPVFALAALALLDDRLAMTFPKKAATIGTLTQHVALFNPYQLSSEIGRAGSNGTEIWPQLRRIVSQTFSIPEEEIFPDSRFVEDLCVD